MVIWDTGLKAPVEQEQAQSGSGSEFGDLLSSSHEALEIACDFLEQHWEMDSVPLTKVVEARNKLRKHLGR